MARILSRRAAGPEHEVATVDGWSRSYRPKPCPTCPWRRDAVGIFPAEAFRLAAPVAYDMSERLFACHEIGGRRPATCAGFLLQSHHNLAVRIGVTIRRFDLSAISSEAELFEDYRAMAEANGVAPDDPALADCR
jgi:hypothetical protein